MNCVFCDGCGCNVTQGDIDMCEEDVCPCPKITPNKLIDTEDGHEYSHEEEK